jgi:hypothetical protein
MRTSETDGRPPGFLDGMIDGLFARRFWDPAVAAAPKSLGYILGELWAMSTQPLALLAAVLDYEDLSRARPRGAPR